MLAVLPCGVGSPCYSATPVVVKGLRGPRGVALLQTVLGTRTETRKPRIRPTHAQIPRVSVPVTRYLTTEHRMWPAVAVGGRALGGDVLDTHILVPCHLG